MPGLTIVFGIILILQGIITYFLSEVDSRSFTALIPAIFGALLVVSGALAKKPDLRKHAMHAAAVVGVIGILGALMRAIPAMAAGKPVGLALGSQIAMAIILIIFVVLCVRSFIEARKARLGQVQP